VTDHTSELSAEFGASTTPIVTQYRGVCETRGKPGHQTADNDCCECRPANGAGMPRSNTLDSQDWYLIKSAWNQPALPKHT